MTAQHTPGPWIWGDEYKGLYGAGPDNEVLNYASYEGMWIGWGQSRNANARLIASAPDLLEALIGIEPFIPKTSAAEGGAAKYSANVAAADKVRAAIAKATGQQGGAS